MLPLNLEYDFDQQMPDIGAVALNQHGTSLLLSHIVSHCRDQSLFFDLDSTLLNNRPRSSAIMREFGDKYEIEKLKIACPEHFPDWSFVHTMGLLGLNPAEIDTLHDTYLSFWQRRFFTSEYCKHDIPIEGASEYVQSVSFAGAQIIYLTGRHDAMRAGTLESLSRLGFPLPDSQCGPVQLITKATFEESDDCYKRRVIGEQNDTSLVLAAFDNEPSHINFYRTEFPDAISVHLMTDHSMSNTVLKDGVLSIKSFA